MDKIKENHMEEEIDFEKITPEEELELIARWKKGDRNARDIIVLKCQRMLGSLASKYYIRGFDKEDLVVEGNIKLLDVIKDYNPQKENAASFSTYARTCVKNHFIELLGKTIANSKTIWKEIFRMTKIKDDYYKQYGEEPTDEELAAIMDISIDKLCKIRLATMEEIPCDLHIGDNEYFSGYDKQSYEDYSSQGASEAEREALKGASKEEMEKWLESLEDMTFPVSMEADVNGRQIIELLYGCGRSEEIFEPKEVAKALSISTDDLKNIVDIILCSAKDNKGIKEFRDLDFDM